MQSQRFNYFIKFISIIFLLCACSIVQAHEKVVVVPLFGGHSKPLKNIITVAKANGDYSNPLAAVASINDASATNPYLIIIAPGEYTLTEGLNMKEYVSITGSGENVTKLIGAISSEDLEITSAIVQLNFNSTLSNLTVKNTGGNFNSIGIIGRGIHSCQLENVSIFVQGATKNYGIYNSSNVKMANIFIKVSGGTHGYGIVNTPFYNPILNGVIISVVDTENAKGILNRTASPTISDVEIEATGSSSSYGIYNTDRSTSVMSNITAFALGSANSYGIFDSSESSSKIRRSTLSGETYGFNSSSDANPTIISQSTIENGTGGLGSKSCVACDNGSGSELTPGCGNE